jgi:hypothetical protein
MNNVIANIVLFDPRSPFIHIRSGSLLEKILGVYICDTFNIEVELNEVSDIAQQLVNLYINCKPNHNLLDWITTQTGSFQTVYSMREPSAAWINLYTQPPHLPWRNTAELLALLGGQGASAIPPLSSSYLISFNGIKISFQVKCNLPVIEGAAQAIKLVPPLNQEQLTNIGAICETNMTVWDITNPLHSVHIDGMLHLVTTTNPTLFTEHFQLLTL